MKKDKFLLRLILSPIILLIALLVSVMFIIIPIPVGIVVMYYFSYMLVYPFVCLLRLSGVEIESCVFIEYSRYEFVNIILSVTINMWVPFYIAYFYVRYGELLTEESSQEDRERIINSYKK